MILWPDGLVGFVLSLIVLCEWALSIPSPEIVKRVMGVFPVRLWKACLVSIVASEVDRLRKGVEREGELMRWMITLRLMDL